MIVLSFIGLLVLVSVGGTSSTTTDADIKSLYSTVDEAREDYLRANQTAEPNATVTSQLLVAGADLVMAARAASHDAGVEIKTSEVREHLRIIPLAIGCRRLDPDNDEKLRRITIYLGQDHRPGCDDVEKHR
jgi:hypothetical protein